LLYPDAIQRLYDLRWFGAKFGLANTLKLAELSGNPQNHLRFIHVAGTNGKGSTCAMLESIYHASGLKVGLFTSPHLVTFRERIQVNRQPISEQEVVQLVEDLQPLLGSFPPEEHPTFFEVVTIMALRYFSAQRCDLVLWETGLGGRLDATNIVTPLASVITNIQYDHQKWLGETLASIAAEKAGIIKPGIPVITGADAPEALHVIVETARQQNAPLTVVAPSEMLTPPLNELHLPLLGHHQQMNAAVALAATRVLSPILPLTQAAIRQGLETVNWPGRMQVLQLNGGRKVILDGAHNAAGAGILAAAVKEFFQETEPVLILGILRDKDWQRMCQHFAPLSRRILLVPVNSERTADPHLLAEACRQANPDTHVAEFPSLTQALIECADAPFVIIAGSLYLVGEALELLQSEPARSERHLNEWITPSQSRWG
jgi:dihydrofolate synthase/folylpolyglutamate synthase